MIRREKQQRNTMDSVTHAVGIKLRIQRMIGRLRLQSFDVETPVGRAKERQRRVLWTAVAAAVAKGVALLTNIVSLPLAIRYLGNERFGMWATISALVAMISFADFGLGNGLLNAVSGAYGKGDRDLAKQYVSSGFFFLLGLAVFFGFLFLLIFPFVSWENLFNVDSKLAIREAGPAVAVFGACFIVSLPFGSVERIQLAYQEGFVNSIWNIVGNVLGLIGVLSVIYFERGLPWLVLVLLGGPLAARVLNGLCLVLCRRRWLLPRLTFVRRDATRGLLRLGLMFFVLQISVAIGYQSDNIVIAQVLGAEQVAQYAIPARMFGMISVVGGFALAALWPAYAEAIAREDISWVKKMLRSSMIATFIVYTVPVVFLIIFGRQLVAIWIGDAVQPSYLLLLCLGVWTLLTAITGPIASFMNGASIIRFQIVTALLMAAVNLILSIVLVRNIGVAGAALGSIISVLTCILIPSFVFLKRQFKDIVPTF